MATNFESFNHEPAPENQSPWRDYVLAAQPAHSPDTAANKSLQAHLDGENPLTIVDQSRTDGNNRASGGRNSSPLEHDEKARANSTSETDQNSGVDSQTKKEPEAPLKEGEEEKNAEQNRQAGEKAKNNTKGWDDPNPPSLKELQTKIGDAQVILWGDVHPYNDSPERFKNALPELKKSGVDTIALEGIGKSAQPVVDKWLGAEKGSDEEAKLASQIRAALSGFFPKGQEAAEKNWIDKYMKVFDAIKDARMKKIICLEPNDPNAPRDEDWTKTLKDHVEANPNSKIAIFAGFYHFAPLEGNIADMLAHEDIKTVDLTPPSYYDPLIQGLR